MWMKARWLERGRTWLPCGKIDENVDLDESTALLDHVYFIIIFFEWVCVVCVGCGCVCGLCVWVWVACVWVWVAAKKLTFQI